MHVISKKMVYKIPGNKINSLTKLLVAEDLVGLLLQAKTVNKERKMFLGSMEP